MIEFRGKITGKTQNYMLKRSSRLGLIAGIIIIIPFIIITIIAIFTWDWIASLFIPCLIFGVVISGMPANKKYYDNILPSSVYLSNDGNIVSSSPKFKYIKPISRVKRVIDYGEWYHIFFDFKYRNGQFVCQKNLIVTGSIEEFEKLFDGKIIRK